MRNVRTSNFEVVPQFGNDPYINVFSGKIRLVFFNDKVRQWTDCFQWEGGSQVMEWLWRWPWMDPTKSRLMAMCGYIVAPPRCRRAADITRLRMVLCPWPVNQAALRVPIYWGPGTCTATPTWWHTVRLTWVSRHTHNYPWLSSHRYTSLSDETHHLVTRRIT